MRGALNLHLRGTSHGWCPVRECQVVYDRVAPPSILAHSFACFVPALHEIVLYIRNSWACKLDISIVVLPFTATVTRGNKGVWIEIDTADKGGRRIFIDVDEPSFLMLAITRSSFISTDFEVRILLRKCLEMVDRPPKGIASVFRHLFIWPPKDNTYVNIASGGPLKHSQSGTATVRHLEGWPHEGHRDPNALTGRFNGLADATESRFPIDPKSDPMTVTCRIITSGYKG